MAVSSVGASWGQQVTLKDNYQPVQLVKLVTPPYHQHQPGVLLHG